MLTSVKYVLQSLLNTLIFMPKALAVGFCAGILLIVIVRPDKPLRRFFDYFCTATYLFVVAKLTFFTRESGSHPRAIDFQLLGTFHPGTPAGQFFYENILLFIPAGIFLPILFPVQRRWYRTLLSGCLCSCTIEFAQLITGRGYCQVDDVLTNSLGTLIGYAIWFLCSLPYRRKHGAEGHDKGKNNSRSSRKKR